MSWRIVDMWVWVMAKRLKYSFSLQWFGVFVSMCACVSINLFLFCLWRSNIFFPEASWICVCLCVLLGSTSQCILNYSSQNLDNCRVFSMLFLQFSLINIFLSFKEVYIISLQLLRDLREEEREEERGRVWFERLESHKFIGIFWCDFLGFSECMFLGNLRDEILKISLF